MMTRGLQSTPFLYGLYQNKNEDSKGYGKWYGRAVILDTVQESDIADFLVGEGSKYSASVIKGVLADFHKCCFRNLLQNRRIKMTGLGTLYAGLVTKGADAPENFNDKNILGFRIGIIPDNTKEFLLSSGELKTRCYFSHEPTNALLTQALSPKDENQQGDIENP